MTPILFHPSRIINEFLAVNHFIGAVDDTGILFAQAGIQVVPTRSTDQVINTVIRNQSIEPGTAGEVVIALLPVQRVIAC